ncbi:MAG: hypothetical protein GTO17_11995 [Candidatus Aminicenantes bacterium]|nr:hypothetical protein [Candidatus Aminicenantes bacterium]
MKKFAIWTIAIIITLATALYQRRTGPTYPVEGKAELAGSTIRYILDRSHGGEEDHEVQVKADNRDVTGSVQYKRYKTDDPWTTLAMLRQEDLLTAKLPHQPPAGKLAYKVILSHEEEQISLTGERPVIIRFRGDVSPFALIPHVIIMFLAMLFSNRAGIEALRPTANPRKYAIWTLVLLFVGGIILGSIVQKLAFGVFWTGFPLGYDLTDNKTLIALIGWLVAVIAGRGGKPARWWVLGAAILLLVVYLIPHSLMGSELDYSQMISSP